MDILFHEHIYSKGISDTKMISIEKKIRKQSPKLNLFLVTLPIGQQGILEIYWYPELLQPFYRSKNEKVTVVGVAKSREDAFSLVEEIIQDVGWKDGIISVADYFEEKA